MTAFRKYFLISITIALLSSILLIVFFVPRFDNPDTKEYVATINHIAGNSEFEIVNSRVLKPLPVLIGALLIPVLKAENTLVVQNLFFYFLSVCLIFLLVYRLYHNEKQAFYGVVLYVAAYPMLAFGLAPLTDMPGWFFYLLSILIILNFLRKPQIKTVLLAGLVAGFGMLFKESMVAVPIFFVSLLLITTQLSIKEKLRYILVFGTAFLLFPFINSIVIYKLFSYSYLDWFGLGGIHGSATVAGFYMIGPLRIVIEIGRVLLIGWVFVLLGAFKEFTLRNTERIKILIALAFSSLYVFLWCYPHNRMIYATSLFLILLGSFGLLRKYKNQKINSFIELTLLSLYVFVNYAALEFFLRYGDFLQGFLIYD